jgi:SAM-dependent methyltransferase
LTTSTDKMTLLVVGCGRRQALSDYTPTRGGAPLTEDEVDLVTLDTNPHVNPRLLCTLGRDPIDLADNSVDLCIALHVLEHIGPAGDATAWFYTFEEQYRVLKPNAMIQFECPYYSSVWAWADPTHVRAISEYSFLYLNQDAYTCGGSIPDFRPACDFVLASWETKADGNPEVVALEGTRSHIHGRLVARKPFNPYWLR